MTNTTSPSSPTTNNAELEMRALVTSKEAGIIIGKGGKNVASIRTLGVRAGVSKVVTGVHERILTISGTVDALASAFGMVAQLLQEGSTIKLLVANGFMGSIIGKQGTTIRRIQDSSSCRLNVSKEQLPNSGERMIELFGTVEGMYLFLIK